MQSDEQSPGGVGRAGRRRTAARVAAAVLFAQVVVIVGFVAFFLIEAARGEASELSAVATSVFIFVVAAFGLAALARGWLAGRSWPRTPTLVWQALLVPVGWSLAETHHGLLAAGVIALAVGGLAAALAGPGADRFAERPGPR